MINISSASKPAILAALYNRAKVQGLGFIHFDPSDMDEKEAESLLKKSTHFDYLKGRVMKIRLDGDELDPRLYDRDNGDGAAYNAIKHLLDPEPR